MNQLNIHDVVSVVTEIVPLKTSEGNEFIINKITLKMSDGSRFLINAFLVSEAQNG